MEGVHSGYTRGKQSEEEEDSCEQSRVSRSDATGEATHVLFCWLFFISKRNFIEKLRPHLHS